MIECAEWKSMRLRLMLCALYVCTISAVTPSIPKVAREFERQRTNMVLFVLFARCGVQAVVL